MKAILVDDEALALDFLELQLKKVSSISILGKFTHFNLEENKKLLEEIDVLFLDIDMPGMPGIEVAKELQILNPSLIIVFVTAHNDFATEAFDLNVFDYILKPIQLDRLRRTCKRIEETLPRKDKQILQIQVSSELTFQLPDGTVVRPVWRTAKVKELFLYLLHERETSIRKSELAELLWPGIPSETSYSRLYTAIYHIRKTLQKYGDALAIESTDEGYAICLKQASIDLVDWEERLISFSSLTAENIQDCEQVMTLYRGPYLDKYDYVWAEPERYRLEQLWLDHALRIARFHEKQANLQKAVNWYSLICNVQPENEEAVLSLLKGHAKMGNHALVAKQYKQFKETMAELDIKIAKEIADWYNAWNYNFS